MIIHIHTADSVYSNIELGNTDFISHAELLHMVGADCNAGQKYEILYASHPNTAMRAELKEGESIPIQNNYTFQIAQIISI